MNILVKYFLALSSITASLFVNAQNFSELILNPPLNGVRQSSIAFSDLNSDGNKDILITGEDSSDILITKLYINDGEFHFTEMTNPPFEGVWGGSISVADLNGDNKDDVFITGGTSSGIAIAKLYINDGSANFTEMTNTPFVGVRGGSAAFSDVNSDGSNDILITGENDIGLRLTRLFINNGSGGFTESTSSQFDGIRFGSISFADVNGDNKDDLLITGEKEYFGFQRIAKLYINDGTGHFTEATNTPFSGVRDGAVAFADINGDNKKDVVITGMNNSEQRIAKLYTNDGLGHFTEMTNTPFDGVRESSVAFADVNNDNKNDLLITGMNNLGERIAKLYTNDGLGHFTEILDTPFDGVSTGDIAFSDLNNDNKEELLITGANSSGDRIAKLYTNGTVSSTNNMLSNENFSVKLFPNPSVASSLYIQYKSTQTAEAIVKIYSIDGLPVKQQNIAIVKGEDLFSIDTSSMKPGIYFAELAINKKREFVKFIIR